MTVMNESGTPPGIATISIEGNCKTGHIRIWIINGEIEPKIIEIPIGPVGKLEAGFLVFELDNAKIVAAGERHVIVKL